MILVTFILKHIFNQTKIRKVTVVKIEKIINQIPFHSRYKKNFFMYNFLPKKDLQIFIKTFFKKNVHISFNKKIHFEKYDGEYKITSPSQTMQDTKKSMENCWL